MKKILLLAAFCAAVFSNAQTIIYNADFSNNGDGFPDHTSSAPPVAGPTSVGPFGLSPNSWELSYSTTPSTDGSANSFKVVSGELQSDDWGGQGIFLSQNIDVSSISSTNIMATGVNSGANDDNFTYFYILDGGSRVETSIGASSNGDSINYSVVGLDVSSATSLIVGFEFNENGGGDGYDISVFQVTDTSSTSNPAPVISNIDINPSSPTSSDLVGVAADVTDAEGLSNVEIQYGFSPGVYDQAPITMMLDRGDTYFAQIPTQADGTNVYFQIVATDNVMNVMDRETTTSAEQSYLVQDPVAISVIINEMSQGSGGSKEWAELLVVQNNLDMRGFELGDNDDGSFTSFVTFSNDMAWSAVSAGTIIVVYNASDVDGVITPDTDFSDLSVTIASNNATYFTGSWGSFGNSDGDDTAVIRDASSNIIHDMAITHPNASVESPGSGNAKGYNSNLVSLSELAMEANWSTVAASNATPGFGNGDLNNALISNLRGIPYYVYNNSSWTPSTPEGNSTTSNNVLIAEGSIAFTGDVDMNNLTLLGSSSLDLGANTLNLVGDVSSPAGSTLMGSEASINFAGVDLQNLNVDNIILENLILNNANGVSLNGAVSLEGVLTLSNGALNTNSNLKLTSSAGKSAVVAPVLSGSIIGDVTVEQYYSDKRAYRLVGSTVETSTGSIFDNWQQSGLNPGDLGYESGFGTHITGGTLANGFDQSGSNAVSMFTYSNVSQVWQGVTNTNANSLSPGNAYRLFIRGDRSVSLTTANAPSTSTILRTKGALSNSFVDINNLSTTDGAFNFIANPYQAQVNFATLMADADTEDINETVYYAWDPTIGDNGAYVTYDFGLSMNNVGGSEVDQFLQPGQAVFVVTSEDGDNAGLTPGMRFKQSFKVSSTDTNNVYRNSNNGEMIAISLYKDTELNTGLARDGVIMGFDANQVIDAGAVKFQNPDENLAISKNNQFLSILKSNTPSDGEIINLELNGLTGNDYTVEVNNDFSSLQAIWVDHYLLTETVLNQGLNSFSVVFDPSQPSSYAADRFSIKFSDSTLSVDDSAFAKAVTLYPNPLGNSILTIENLDSGQDVNIKVLNSLGQVVKSFKESPANGVIEIKNLQILESGIYLLNIEQATRTVVKRFIKN